jgi:hypothetical protein
MSLSYTTLASSKRIIKESLLGGGAIVGKNVTVSAVTPIDGGNRVTFSYVLDNGEKRESFVDVMDGFSPTITENRSNNDSEFRLDIVTKNRTFTTPNLMNAIDLSNVVVDISLSGNTLSVVKGNGSVKKIKLPTVSGGGSTVPDDEEEEVNGFAVSSLLYNASKELEMVYVGEPTQELPDFDIDYASGELSVNNNGNNNVTFNVNNKDLEVTY